MEVSEIKISSGAQPICPAEARRKLSVLAQLSKRDMKASKIKLVSFRMRISHDDFSIENVRRRTEPCLSLKSQVHPIAPSERFSFFHENAVFQNTAITLNGFDRAGIIIVASHKDLCNSKLFGDWQRQGQRSWSRQSRTGPATRRDKTSHSLCQTVLS